MRQILTIKWSYPTLLVLACCITSSAQDGIPFLDRDASLDSLTVPVERETLLALKQARQLIGKQQYRDGVQLLQFVLERPEDEVLTKRFASNSRNPVGSKGDALKQLMSIPAEGREAYEVEYGATARALLIEAQEAGDMEAIAAIVRRFPLTRAGYDAITFLASYALDQGDALKAAMLLDSLRTNPQRTPQLLLQTAVCWMYADQPKRCLEVLANLKAISPGGKLRIGSQDVALFDRDEDAVAWLRHAVGKALISPPPEAVDSWRMPGGTATRNGAATSASPVGGVRWRVSLFEHLTLDGRSDADEKYRSQLRGLVHQATVSMQNDNRPLVPAAQPLVIGDTVVYRTIGDVTAVRLKTGELLWRSASVDDTLVRLINARGQDLRVRNLRVANLPPMSLSAVIKRRVYRDLVAGTLSCDGATVFGLEEIDTSAMAAANFVSMPTNKLVAYDLAGGRKLWEIGGPRGTRPAELSSQYFLGPPLPIEGRLYVLAEAQGSLRLLVLEQDSSRQSVHLAWSQTLIATGQFVLSQPLRRLSGLSPSAFEGILVCPTSTGAVVAVDMLRRAILWGHEYPSLGANPNPSMPYSPFVNYEEFDEVERWMDTIPIIAGGRVLTTNRDSKQLYCLDLLTGREVWKLPRGDMMFIAGVIDERVILVGRQEVTAVNLTNGRHVEGFESAKITPVGRGVRSNGYYCLPTSNGEVATVDLRTGRIMAQSKLTGSSLPGNLVAGNGTIVSQSADELVGFTPVATIERQIAEDLQKDPQQPEALALRGELRLHQGNQAAGLADLRASTKRNPAPHVKSVIAATLLSMARTNPESIRDNIDELETVTDDPQQKNEFLLLYSRWLEKQSNAIGAFTQLTRLAETSRFLTNMEARTTEYHVRRDRLVRARLLDLYNSAAADKKGEFDRVLQSRIHEIIGSEPTIQPPERSLRFLRSLPNAELAALNSLAKLKGPASTAQRESVLKSLSKSADSTIAGPVTAIRCQELLSSGQVREALPLFNVLRNEFGGQVCLEGKTGRILFNEFSSLNAVQRVLTPPTTWIGTIDFDRQDKGSIVSTRTPVPCEIISRGGGFMTGWTFETDPSNFLNARDAEGRHQWKLSLADCVVADPFNNTNLQNPVQIHILDHWLALSLGTHLLVVETGNAAPAPRIAWKQALRTSDLEMMVNPRFPIRRSRPGIPGGQLVGLTRETVVYSLGDRLIGADLESGQLAWSRQNAITVPFEASMDDRVVVIQQNSSSELTLYRTLDGQEIATRSMQPGDVSLWVRGGKQLALRTKDSGAILVMHDVEKDVILWDRPCSPDVIATVIEDDDVAILDANGLLTVLKLADGAERYHVELAFKPTSRETSWIAVQRNDDRDIILAGEEIKQKSIPQQFPFDTTNSAGSSIYDGYVFGVSRADGRLLWTTAVEKMGFDRSQPVALPVLLLVARQERTTANRVRALNQVRMFTTLIDKRTGQRFFSQEDLSPPVTPRLERDPDNRRIIANFFTWQLNISFSGTDVPKPR